MRFPARIFLHPLHQKLGNSYLTNFPESDEVKDVFVTSAGMEPL